MSSQSSEEEQLWLPIQKQLSSVCSPISCSPASIYSHKHHLDSSQHLPTASEGHHLKQRISLHNLLNIFTGGDGGYSLITNISHQTLRHVSNSHYSLHPLAEVHRFGVAPSCGGRSHHLTSCPLTREHLLQHRRSHLQQLGSFNSCQQQHVQRALFTEKNSDGKSRPVLTALLCGMPLNANPLTTESGGTRLDSTLLTPNEEVIMESPLLVSRVLTSVDNLHQLSSSLHCKSGSSTSSLWSNPSIRNAQSTSTRQTPYHNTTNDYQDAHMNDSDHQNHETQTFSVQQAVLQQEGCVHMIPVPVSVNKDGPVDEWRKVYRYPSVAVTTIVERRSYLEPPSETGSVSSVVSGADVGQSSRAKRPRIRRKRGGSNGRLPGSISSSELSQAFTWDASSNLSSGLSNAGSTFSLNTTVSGSRVSFLPFNLSKNLAHSDASSCASNISDLSSYETEYIRIKQLISDSPGSLLNVRDLGVKSKKNWPTIAEIHDFESAVKDLTTQKEDLEIQVHRLSTQLQNAIKEKEICQEHLETMKANVTDVNQRQMFEVLKEKADLEGRLEVEVKKRTDVVEELRSLKEAMSDEVKEKELYASKSNDLIIKEEDYYSKIASLQNELQCSMVSASKLEQAHAILATKNVEFERLLGEKTTKAIQYEEQLEQLTRSLSDKTGEVDTLSDAVDRLTRQVKTQQIEKLNYVSENEKLSSDLESVTKWQSWLKEQLEAAQDARQALQEQLKNTREKVIELTAQRNANADTAQSLQVELNETCSRAVRERNALVLKLETLQEDLVGYEEQIRKHQNHDQEGNAGESQVLLEKMGTLQKDYKKLRLQFIDTERRVEGLEEKIGHKNVLVRRYENELKELRTAAVVNGELVVENNIRLDALVNQINEKNMIINDLKKELIKKETNLKIIREEKMQVDIKLSGTMFEKLEVDQATFKVKEDINKLSSSLFRMKHDLTSREREIVRHKEEINTLLQAKFFLEAQVKGLQDTLQSTTAAEQRGVTESEGDEATNSNDKLAEQLRLETDARKVAEVALGDVTSKLGVLELETKSLSEAVQLRDHEIQSLQQSLVEYGELVAKKDGELGRAEALRRSKEGECAEWSRKVRELNKDVTKVQEKLTDRTAEVEKCKGEIRSLRDSLHKEYKLKQAIEKKIELNNVQFSKERSNMMLESSSLKKKWRATEDDLRETTQELNKVKNNLVCKETDLKCLQEALEAETQSSLDLERKFITLKENHACESEAMIVEESSMVRKVVLEDMACQSFACIPHTAETKADENSYGKMKTVSVEAASKDRQEVCTFRDKLNEDAQLLESKQLEVVKVQSEPDSVQEHTACLHRAIDGLTIDIETLRVQCSSLNDANCLLESRVCDSKAAHEEAVKSLSRVREALKNVTEERDQWQASYQSLQGLVDTIPQRDTDSCFTHGATATAAEPAVSSLSTIGSVSALSSVSAVALAGVGTRVDGVDVSSICVRRSEGPSDVSGYGDSKNLCVAAGGNAHSGVTSAPGLENPDKWQSDLAKNLTELPQKSISTLEVLSTKEQKLSSVCLQLNEQSKKMQKLREEVVKSKGLRAERKIREAAELKLQEEVAMNESLSTNRNNLREMLKSYKDGRVINSVPGSCSSVQADLKTQEADDDKQQMLLWTKSSAGVEQLERNVLKLTAENEGYKQRIEQQQSIIEHLNIRVSQSQIEQSQLHKVTAEANKCREYLSSCECQRNESVKKMIESECFETDIMKQVSELKHRNNVLSEQVSKLRKENDEQNDKINEYLRIANEKNTKMTENDRETNDLRGQIMALESTNNDLTNQASELLNRNCSLVEKIARIESACSDHRDQLKEVETRFTDLKEQITKEGTRVKDLTGKLSTANASNRDLCQRSEELHVVKETLMKELSLHKSESQTLQKKLSELESDRDDLIQQASELESHRRALQEKLSEVQSGCEVLQKQLTESTAKQRRCESNVNLLTRKLREHLKGRKEAESEAARMRQRAEEAEGAGRREVTAIKERLLATETSLEAAEAANSNIDARLRQEQLEQHQLRETFQLRQQELLLLRQRLAAAEEEYAEWRGGGDASSEGDPYPNPPWKGSLPRLASGGLGIYKKGHWITVRQSATDLETEAAKLQLEKDAREAASQLKTLLTEQAELKNDLTALRAQLTAETRFKEELEARVAQLEAPAAEVTELRASSSKLSAELATVTTELELRKQREGKLDAEVREFKAAQQQFDDQLQQVLKEKSGVEEELEREKRRGDDELVKCERLASDEREKRAVLDKQLEMSARELNSLEAALTVATTECERREKECSEAVAQARGEALRSRQMVSELEEQAVSQTARLELSERELNAAVGERQAALITNAELRMALTDSLRQIRAAMSSQTPTSQVEEGISSRVLGRVAPSTPPLSSPSPASLDTAALQALLERAQAADHRGSLEPLASLQGSLASFKQELCTLQDAVHRSTQRYLTDPLAEADLDMPSDAGGSEMVDD